MTIMIMIVIMIIIKITIVIILACNGLQLDVEDFEISSVLIG